MESDTKSESTITCASPSEDEMDEIRLESKCERPTSALRLKVSLCQFVNNMLFL